MLELNSINGIILSLFISLTPLLIVLGIFYLIKIFKKGSTFEKLLERFVMGYVIFYIFYIFVPALINVINPPENEYLIPKIIIDLNPTGTFTQGYWEASLNSFIRYWIQLFINSLITYLVYPLSILPVIFILGAVISFILVLYTLKKEAPDEKLAFSISTMQYGIEDNPLVTIAKRLKNPDWQSSKELLKILLAILPISLYLLMTVLKVTGHQENPNILQGTSLGWFLEIFFVYLASLMFGVHLLYSSKFSFKGDYIGLKLRNAMIQSLSTVGAVVSAIAIILFVIDYSRQLFVVIYFIMYFIMVTFFFVLFLDIFEPISIYLVSKLVESFKNYSSSTIEPKIVEEQSGQAEPVAFDFDIPSAKVSDLADEPLETEKDNVLAEEIIEVEAKDSSGTEDEKKVLIRDLKSTSFRSGLKIFSRSIFTLIMILGVMYILDYVFVSMELTRQFNSAPLQTISFLSIFIIMSIPLLISFFLFSKNLFKIQLGAIILHSILVIIDFAFRAILININGLNKFSTIAYLNIYFSLQVFIVTFITAFSLVILRRFNWNSLINLSIIFITGVLMAITWVFAFNSNFSVIIPFINETFINGLTISNPSSIQNNSPIPTYNIIVAGIIAGGESWVTYTFLNVHLSSLGTFIVLPVVSGVSVNFVPLLGISSLPFRFFQPFSTILLYGMIIFLAGNEFLTVAYKDESIVDKIIYSERQTIPTLHEIKDNPNKFAIARNFGLDDENEVKSGFSVTEIEESIYQIGIGAHLVQFIGEAPITFDDLTLESSLSIEEMLDFFNELSKTALSKAKPFMVFDKEFGYSYEEAKMDSIHIMMSDGRSVFTHTFTEESTVEPALVSGLFSAITSFAKETVKSEQRLRTIDHGDVVLLIEYGLYVFSAIFADKNSVELRNKLIQFINIFEEKHKAELDGWLGDTSPFADDWMLINEIFEID